MALGVKAVIFDVDGTLFDRDLAQRMVATDIIGNFPHVFNGFNPEFVVDVFMQSHPQSVADFEAGMPSDGLRDKRTKIFLQLLGVNEAYADRITEVYVRDYPMINSPIAGAIPLVKELNTRFLLGVVSNGLPDVQYRKLDTIGLKDIFSCIVLSEEIGIRKPDPRIFQYAAKMLQIQPPECLYVGDSYHNDVVGAKAAGMRACWYDCGSPAPESRDTKADFVIAGIRDLSKILEKQD